MSDFLNPNDLGMAWATSDHKQIIHDCVSPEQAGFGVVDEKQSTREIDIMQASPVVKNDGHRIRIPTVEETKKKKASKNKTHLHYQDYENAGKKSVVQNGENMYANTFIKDGYSDVEVEVPKTSEVDETEEFSQFNRSRQRNLGSDPYNIALLMIESGSFAVLSKPSEQLYLYCDNTGSWKLIPETQNMRELRSVIPDEYSLGITKQKLAEIHEWIIIKGKKLIEKEDSRFFLNFKNVAVDWRNGDTISGNDRKKMGFRYFLDFKYDPAWFQGQSEGIFLKYVRRALSNDENTLIEFRKFFGLAVSGIRDLKYAFIIIGANDSGKSLLLKVLKSVVGQGYCASLSFSQMGEDFAITQLMGKRLNLSGEVSGTTQKRLDIFMSLTGNDDVTTEYKGRDHFQMLNEALLVFACNTFPKIADPELFRFFLHRIIIFPFRNPVKRENCRQDMLESIMQDIPGIFSFAIQGLRDLKRDGFRFTESEYMKGEYKDFQFENDSFSAFALQRLKSDPDSKLTSQEIDDEYKIFCRENECPYLEVQKWSRIFQNFPGCERSTKVIPEVIGQKSRRVRAYKGYALKKIEGDEYEYEQDING